MSRIRSFHTYQMRNCSLYQSIYKIENHTTPAGRVLWPPRAHQECRALRMAPCSQSFQEEDSQEPKLNSKIRIKGFESFSELILSVPVFLSLSVVHVINQRWVNHYSFSIFQFTQSLYYFQFPSLQQRTSLALFFDREKLAMNEFWHITKL